MSEPSKEVWDLVARRETAIEDALHHLVRVIGICQIPHEKWTDEEITAFTNARRFAQAYRERHESKRAEGDSADAGSAVRA
jgi:hypothetical protein